MRRCLGARAGPRVSILLKPCEGFILHSQLTSGNVRRVDPGKNPKSFYLAAHPVFYRVGSNIETLATPHGPMDQNMYGRLNLVLTTLNCASAIQNAILAMQM